MSIDLSKLGRFMRRTTGLESVTPPPAADNSHRSLEAGFAVARAVVVLSVPLAIGNTTASAQAWVSTSSLAAIYSLYAAAVILAVVTLATKPATWLLVAIHVADIFWAFIFAERLHSMGPALLLMVFPLLTATLRWGPSATLATTLALVGVLQTTVTNMSISVDLQTVLIRFQTTASVILLGVLFAHIGHRQRQAAKAEASPADGQFSGSPALVIDTLFDQAFSLFKPAHVQLLVEESNTGRMFLWLADRHEGTRSNVHSQEFDQSSAEPHLALMPAGDWVLRSTGSEPVLTYLKDRSAKDREQIPPSLSQYFKPYSVTVSSVIDMGSEWKGRFIVCDPSKWRSAKAAQRALKAFSGDAAPRILTAQVCLRACRETAAEERARLARELHDGVIQSLLGVDLQLESMKRHLDRVPELNEEVDQIQDVLRHEALGLRQLVNDSRRKALSPERLLEYLSDLLERFQRDYGIVTQFFADLDTDRMPPRICHEIARIADESVVNARKHSGAATLTVRLGSNPDSWLLIIVDDGSGFDFRGQWRLEKLVSSGLGPAVIMDRVQALGGDLLIDSTAAGSRIEINIPKLRHSPQSVFKSPAVNDEQVRTTQINN